MLIYYISQKMLFYLQPSAIIVNKVFR